MARTAAASGSRIEYGLIAAGSFLRLFCGAKQGDMVGLFGPADRFAIVVWFLAPDMFVALESAHRASSFT
jgi:hypothetical protein